MRRFTTKIAAICLTLLLALLPGQSSAQGDIVWGSVSAYCITGTTASGAYTHWGGAAGASWLPFGSLVYIPGWGVVTILDRGQPGLFLVDIAAPGDCVWARQWGRQWLPISILRWGW